MISTGDEIVDADIEPRPGQVRNINQHSLAGLIEECGGELKDWGVVRDDRSALDRSNRRGARMGRCRAAFRRQLHGRERYRLGNDPVFSRFRIYFSRHLDCARQADYFRQGCGKPILGLPGYPVSALVIFDLFAAPLIRRLGGENIDALQTLLAQTARAVLKTNVASQIGREDYVRVTLERQSEKLVATPLPSKSGAIFTLVKADGMVRIDMNQDGLEQGEEVEVILF